jgi:hypothetical protein
MNSIHAFDKMDTSNNDNSLSGGWISSTTNKNKTKRILPIRAHHERRQIKTKNLFSTNRYEVLSQDDPPSTPPSNNNNTVPIQNPINSIIVTPKVLQPPPIFNKRLIQLS